MLCSRCGKDLPATPEFFLPRPNTPKGYHSQCRACRNVVQLRRYHERRERRGRTWIFGIDRIIDETDRCLFHCVLPDYCKRPATWRNGQWRACDTHKRPGDVPISVSDRNATRHEREAAARPIGKAAVVTAG